MKTGLYCIQRNLDFSLSGGKVDKDDKSGKTGGDDNLEDLQDENLSEEERKKKEVFALENPVAATLTNIGGGAALPIPNIFTKTKTIGDALGNVAKSTGLGGVIGSLYGFGCVS